MWLALEPGIEVDIGATCNGLGRALTGRDRHRLWRKVQQWEAFRAQKTLTYRWRDRERWRSGDLDVGMTSNDASRQTGGTGNDAVSGNVMG